MTAVDPLNSPFAPDPPEYPLGVPIAQKVTVNRIDRRAADRVYEQHHSYLPRGRKGWHYGVYLDDVLVGAVTFDAWPSQATIRGYESAEIREVARVCIANGTSNLASCGMAEAQDVFMAEHGRDDGIQLLITYVREGYAGSMFAALRGKGWERDGVSEGRARGPHQGESTVHDIYEREKERWVCEV